MRRGLKVKIWMLEKDIKALDVARSYGCHQGMVSRFLTGDRTSKGLQAHMIKLGCPSQYFNKGRVAA